MPEYPFAQLAADIARSLSPEEFDRAGRGALTFFDALNESVIAGRGVQLACREGCGICCSLRVDVFAHEVFLLARHIRAHFAEDEINALLLRLDAHAEQVLRMTPAEHATTNVPCPMLEHGRCNVYAARPQACRRHHSQDLATCQFTYDHPTDLESPAAHDRALFRTLTEAMQQNIDAYAGFGFDTTIYELGTALRDALDDPASWDRWRQHELAFLEASVTPAA
jgi:Fe-S-cluster containining protein